MMLTEVPRSSIVTHLKTLNESNGADKVCDQYEHEILKTFKKNLIGVIMGVPYGGDVERLGKSWGDKGKIYGYDTFEGHPKYLATGFEAECMDFWYQVLGMEKTTYKYQRQEFDKMGLTNVTLVKGLIHPHSCDDLEYIHYAFIDLDILPSMEAGFAAVRDKMVKGGIIILHDINNIERLITWWNDVIKKDKGFELVEEGRGLTGVIIKL